MTPHDLRCARLTAGLTQVQAAARLRVSQPYLAMLEKGGRRMTADLARRAMRAYRLPATVLPPAASGPALRTGDADSLAGHLAMLGYPGFSHLRPRRQQARNPSEVLLAALAERELDARFVEALPWLMLKYWPLDRAWLLQHAKLHDLQNRLGFVAALARRLAERVGDKTKAQALHAFELEIDHSRLAREDTLCRVSLSQVERRWLTAHRSADAKHWNLLTDWTADALRYTA